MDTRVAWLMPEQIGPAAEYWQNCLTKCDEPKESPGAETMPNGMPFPNGQNPHNPNQVNPTRKPPMPQYTPEQINQLREDKVEILSHHQIKEISPIAQSRDGVRENPAATLNSTIHQLADRKYPWLRSDRSRKKHGVYGLHEEIVDFHKWIIATPEEYQMRFEVVLRVEEAIKQEFPGARVEVFGSFQTGLYLPTSDIDMVVFDFQKDFDNSQPYSNPYYRLQDRLVGQRIAEKLSIKVIDRAAVPIVKMRDLLTDIKVDISFNMESGVTSVALIKEFMHEFPCLPYLVLLLKQFLLQRDMNEVWTGGISSYGLILMTVSFLQNHKRQEGRNKGINMGVLLIEFFELYGRKFNYEKLCIRVKDGGSYMKKEEMAAQMKTDGPVGKYYPNFLSIEDPLTPSNDIGRASHGAETVKEAFNYAYRVLSRAVSPQASSYPSDCTQSILGRIIMITEEVNNYRLWVDKYWKHRVPRLRKEFDRSIQMAAQNNPAQKQITDRNSQGGSSPERADSQSDDEIVNEYQPDAPSPSTPTQMAPEHHLIESKPSSELRDYSDSGSAPDSPHSDSESTSKWIEKGVSKDTNRHIVSDKPNFQNLQVTTGFIDARRGPKRTIQQPRYGGHHAKQRSRDMDFDHGMGRPNKSSQSDSNSNHDPQEPSAKSPNSVSPSKRVNITGGIFQRALTSATTRRAGPDTPAATGGATPGNLGDSVRDKPRNRRNNHDDQRRMGGGHGKNRRDRMHGAYDYDERSSTRSRKSSDSRGSPIPEEIYQRSDYGSRRSGGNRNRNDDNASPNPAGGRFNDHGGRRSDRFRQNDGGHISPQNYPQRSGPAMDQPQSYRNPPQDYYNDEMRGGHGNNKRDRQRNKGQGDRGLYKAGGRRSGDADRDNLRMRGEPTDRNRYDQGYIEQDRLDVGRSGSHRLSNDGPGGSSSVRRGTRGADRNSGGRETFSPGPMDGLGARNR